MDAKDPGEEEQESGWSSEMEQKKVGLMRDMVEREDPMSKVNPLFPFFIFFCLFSPINTHKHTMGWVCFTMEITIENNDHNDLEAGHRLNGQDLM